MLQLVPLVPQAPPAPLSLPVPLLAPQLAVGATCELVDLCMLDEALSINDARERCGACVRLAPHAVSAQQATETIAAMVDDLVADGLIPRAKVRNELQDVHPLSRGFVPPSAGVEPLSRACRATLKVMSDLQRRQEKDDAMLVQASARRRRTAATAL